MPREAEVQDARARLKECASALVHALDANQRADRIEVVLHDLDHARSEYHEALRTTRRSVPHQLYEA